MSASLIDPKKNRYGEVRSSQSVKRSRDNDGGSSKKTVLGEELLVKGGSTFVAGCGDIEDIQGLANRIYRPNRSAPVNEIELESRELCEDSEFMEAFSRGVQELEEGKGVSWENAKKQLGL